MLSVIILSYFSGQRITIAFEKLSKLLNENNIPFEFIIIDDGSEDDSYGIALNLEKSFKNIRAFQLSKNFTSHYAVFAGLSVCEGDCAIPIPDDEQQPYEMIIKMYRLWQAGEKIIVPHRIKRADGYFSNFFSASYYRIINFLSEIKFPKGGADTFFIDREIINILKQKIHPINTSSISEVLRLGYNPVFLPYERGKGINKKSRWSLNKKVQLFKDTFFSSTTWPIKVITSLGVFFSLFSLGIIVFYIYIRLFGNHKFWGEVMPGWTSSIVIISFFSGIILFSLGIIAEYIWRIFEEVKNRPGYIIKEKNNELKK
jgi:polyisoprenyl-phosphate glycosyltransferase